MKVIDRIKSVFRKDYDGMSPLEQLDAQLKIHHDLVRPYGSDNVYMRGFVNGMEFAKYIVTGEPTKYFE